MPTWSLTTTSSVSVTVSPDPHHDRRSTSARPNLNDTQSFSAIGYDQFGAALAAQPSFTWATASGVGSINASGLYTAGCVTGLATITATSGSVVGSAAVTVTNAGPTVATPASATPGTLTGTTTALSVLGADDGGAANLTYTWTVTAEPAGAANPTYSDNGTNAAKNTTAIFSQAGSYTFLVTITDAGGLTATSSVGVTVSQSLSTILVSPASVALNENQAQLYSAVGYDQFGAVLAVQPGFTWGVASGVGLIDGSGLYTAPGAPGVATVTATSGAVSGSATVTVTNAAPTVATLATATPNPIRGTTTSLSVLGDDDGGESNLTYTWTVTAKPTGAADPTFGGNGNNAAKDTTTTFSQAGSYTFLVTITDAGGLTTTSSVAVVDRQREVAGIDVFPTNGLVTTKGGGSARFTVVLTSQPTAPVTIPLVSTNLEEGVINQSSLIFTPADWDVPQSVKVTGVQDFINEGDVAYFVLGGPASSADLSFDGLVAPGVSLTNSALPNQAPMAVVPTLQKTAQNEPLVFSKSGGNAVSVVDPDAGPNLIQVALTVSQGTLSLSSASGLDVTAGIDGSATVTFSGKLDDVNAALDGLSIAPPPDYVGTVWLMVEVGVLGNTAPDGARSDTEIVPIAVTKSAPALAGNAVLTLSNGTVGIGPRRCGRHGPPDRRHRHRVGN